MCCGIIEGQKFCFCYFATFNNLLLLPTVHFNDLPVEFGNYCAESMFCELVMIMPGNFTLYTKGLLS